MPLRMTICTSKEDLEQSLLVLRTLDRKLELSTMLHSPDSEYIFDVFSTNNFSEDKKPVLAVAVFDDNTYAVFAPETLSTTAREELFASFIAEKLFPEDVLIVFTRLDYNAAHAAYSSKFIDIKLMS